MKNQKGFSLIELLIVVVIIGIIAAIAIPNLLAARRSANEGSAVSAMRTLHGAQMTYSSTYGSGNYAAAIGTLSSSTVGLIDAQLGSATGKSGYVFVVATTPFSATTPATFVASGIPASFGGVTATGTRNFGVATDGVIKFAAASATQFTEATVLTASPLAN